MDTEKIKSDLAELETEEEIQDYLENLWREARQTSENINRLTLMYRFSDDMDSDDVINILEQDLEDVNHK